MKTKLSFKKIIITILALCCIACFGIAINKQENKKVNAWTQSDIKYFGYDISTYQGVVNFNVMKNYADFVICRIGYSTSLDGRFLTYMRDAKAAGLHIGIYIFSTADSIAKAQNEADWVISTLANNGFDKGYLDFPVFFDYEVSSVIQSKTGAQNSAIVNAFVDRMANAGYYSALYVGGSNFKSYFDHSTLKCSAWVAHYGYTDQVSYFNDRYGSYNTCMWQFDGDGYDTASTKRGYDVGASSTNIDHDWCFVDFPSIIKEGGYNGFSGGGRTNKVLEDNSGWDYSLNYDRADAEFSNRKISLTSPQNNENPLSFTSSSSKIKVGATFKANGKVSSEKFGKFGISFISGSGGFYFYVDAQGQEGTTLESITGTKLGVVYKNGGTWDWTTEQLFDSVVYDKNKEITLSVEREMGEFVLYANNTKITTLSSEDFGVAASTEITPQIRSFNIALDVTNYYCNSTFADAITIDGNFEDWENLPDYQSIESNKKVIKDSLTQKGAEFYTNFVNQGLFVYFKANHAKTITNQSDWWNNTNFEMFINGEGVANQFYAIHSKFGGFTTGAFVTTGTEGNYVTVFEGFVKIDTITSLGFNWRAINVGFAFKIDNETIKDSITPAGGTATTYWCAENSDPRSVAHFVPLKGANHYEYINATSWKTNGDTLVLDTFNRDNEYYFDGIESTTFDVSATFTVTGKSADQFPKFGIGIFSVDYNGFMFFADAKGTTGTDVASINGTSVGYVSRTSAAEWGWGKESIFDNKWSATSPVTFRVTRSGDVYSLYVGNELIATLNGSTYGLKADRVYYPAIVSFNTKLIVSNYGIAKTAIDGITVDGKFDDWQALDTWSDIQTNMVGVWDSTNPNKGVWFYTRLTDNGLFIYAKANHNVHATGNWNEWWKNTNVEVFLNYGDNMHQIYATEFFNQGFTNKVFIVSGNATSGYTTNFEGYVSNSYLSNWASYTGENIKIGLAFKIDNLDSSSHVLDIIVPQGTTTERSYWCAGNIDPTKVAYTVVKESALVTPPITPEPEPPSSGNSSSSSSVSSNKSSITNSSSISSVVSNSSSVSTSSKNSSTQSSKVTSVSSTSKATSSSVKTTSSQKEQTTSKQTTNSSSVEVSSNINQSIVETSSENTTSSNSSSSKKGGCKSSISSLGIVLLPLAIFAVIKLKKKFN